MTNYEADGTLCCRSNESEEGKRPQRIKARAAHSTYSNAMIQASVIISRPHALLRNKRTYAAAAGPACCKISSAAIVFSRRRCTYRLELAVISLE